MQIDPQRKGKLPKVAPAAPFQSRDGRFHGWRVDFPGKRPLATPAVVDGRVFLGGGFGSYEFYALDAPPARSSGSTRQATTGRPRPWWTMASWSSTPRAASWRC